MTKPLQGIRVLEMGQLIAGPFAGKMLAEFGAQVTKVEPPVTGDPLRKWRLLHEGTSVWWAAQSRNKESLTLDLRSPMVRTLFASSSQTATYSLRISGRARSKAGALAGMNCMRGTLVSSCCAYRATVRRDLTVIVQALASSRKQWAACVI